MGNKKNTVLALFVLTKPNEEVNRESIQSDNEPPFSMMRNCPDSSYKETRHQGWMFALSPQNVLSQPHNHSPQKKQWFLPLSFWGWFLLLCPCTGVCLQLKPLQSYPGALHGGSLRITNTHKYRCMSVHATVSRVRVSVPCIFIKKSYLKWNLSRAACGKHCHVRETAKPYKAFPPKSST